MNAEIEFSGADNETKIVVTRIRGSEVAGACSFTKAAGEKCLVLSKDTKAVSLELATL